MGPSSELRTWRTIIRVTWATAALAGVVVALIPSVQLLAVFAATLLAGAGAFAFMIWTTTKHHGSLRRPDRIKQTPAATTIILVAAVVFGALAGLAFGVVLVLDAPKGLVFPMVVAIGGVGAEAFDWLGLWLARRSSKVREPGTPTATIG